MKTSTKPTQPKAIFSLEGIGLPASYLLAFVVCGWFILIGNLFPVAQMTDGIVPVVDDLPGFIASMLFLAVLALTPLAIRQAFRKPSSSR